MAHLPSSAVVAAGVTGACVGAACAEPGLRAAYYPHPSGDIPSDLGMLLGQPNGISECGSARMASHGQSAPGGGRWDARPLSNYMVRPDTHEKPRLTPAARHGPLAMEDITSAGPIATRARLWARYHRLLADGQGSQPAPTRSSPRPPAALASYEPAGPAGPPS